MVDEAEETAGREREEEERGDEEAKSVRACKLRSGMSSRVKMEDGDNEWALLLTGCERDDGDGDGDDAGWAGWAGAIKGTGSGQAQREALTSLDPGTSTKVRGHLIRHSIVTTNHDFEPFRPATLSITAYMVVIRLAVYSYIQWTSMHVSGGHLQ